MEKENFIEAIQERDIDLLLLEEFYSSESFRKWFLQKTVGLDSKSGRFIGTWHSVSHSDLGESDLIVKFSGANNEGWLFLIENKVDANFQPSQDLRYYKRGEKYIKEKHCKNFNTVIFAPTEYLEGMPLEIGFDFKISYEDLKEFFNKTGLRNEYKSNFITSAIERARRGWKLIENKNITEFWKKYWQYIESSAPELEMSEPGAKPKRSTWVYFHPSNLDKNVHLIHKVEKGYVDLQISGKSGKFEVLKEKIEKLLNSNMRIQKTGKSIVIRIKVSKINMNKDFNTEKNAVAESIFVLKELLEWFKQNKREMCMGVGSRK